jgi:hypothetical protein
MKLLASAAESVPADTVTAGDLAVVFGLAAAFIAVLVVGLKVLDVVCDRLAPIVNRIIDKANDRAHLRWWTDQRAAIADWTFWPDDMCPCGRARVSVLMGFEACCAACARETVPPEQWDQARSLSGRIVPRALPVMAGEDAHA